jgi:tetratricopeptide (TPR) repeat protein
MTEAVSHLKQAVGLDPDYGEAYAALAWAYRYSYGATLGLSDQERNAVMVRYLQEALKHPSPRAYRVRADLLLTAQQPEAAIEDLERAINLNPSDAETFEAMSYAMVLAGRPEDAQHAAEAGLRADPRAAEWLRDDLGFASFTAGRFADAAAALEQYVVERPSDPWMPMILVAAYGHLGRDATQWKEKLSAYEIQEGGVGLSQMLGRVWYPYKRPEDAARLRDGLRLAGVPEFPFPYPEGMERLKDDEIRSALFGRVLRDATSTTGRAGSSPSSRTGPSPLPATASSRAGRARPAGWSRSRMASCAGATR